MKLKERRGVLLSAIGVTEEGKRAVLEIILSREEDATGYWRLLVEVWKKHSFILIVAS
ncbi:hypothetical protein SACC_33050 [Saccharolobus caldissimus]|uniref:Transposase n=1 Tax=Saccharolobus caldissimus TaxID=1702097 RepID=A0AAQ4CWV7_9CREN|nr:hypothetical protein SACC_33050 [Saccharolobus caldissimus]